MSSPVVSILVPCYNVSRYLKECLDTIIHQTYPYLEIICINDGSTDNTLDIIESYAQHDSRIRIINKPNSGYGASMNQGLDMATGEFIGIVESDDFVELDMVAILLKEAIDKDLDISRGAYFRYCTATHINELVSEKYIEKNTVFEPLKKQNLFYQAPSIWAALYKRSFLNNNRIRFLETPGASYQDTSFAFKTKACCRRFSMIDKGLLHYRIDNESSSSNSIGKAFMICKEYEEIWRFTKSDSSRYQTLRHLIPHLQFTGYSWNYRRITEKFKTPFLEKWSETLKSQISSNEIDWLSFPLKDQLRILLIAYYPKWASKLSLI